MSDRIEKFIEINAPVSRVWTALTDHREFGEWFRVKIDGPFVVDEVSRGQMTYPGYEHVKWEVLIKAIEPERLFAFTSHPYAVDSGTDYGGEPPTLVEFTLEPKGEGTLLKVVESGFDRIPAHRRDEAFRMNEGGWAVQMENIRHYASQPQ
jgi:uncharacterized protein YndB with AHSA1/START domain